MLKSLWSALGLNGALIAGGVLLALMGGSWLHGCSYGVDHQKAVQAKAERKARELADKSAGKAAGEREADASAISTKQENRDEAIRNAGDGRPGAASNALNCQRLRDAGKDVSQFPACRGRADGGEAAARP